MEIKEDFDLFTMYKSETTISKTNLKPPNERQPKSLFVPKAWGVGHRREPTTWRAGGWR